MYPVHKKAAHPFRGFTVTELMISLSILAILLSVGVPSFSVWLQNRQIQSVAGSIVDGMHLARSKAIERNTSVNFVLTALPGSAWTIKCPSTTNNCSTGDTSTSYIEKSPTSEGGSNVVVTTVNATLSNPPTFTFNGLGQLTSPTPPGGNLPIFTLTAPKAGSCVASGGSARCLNIIVTASGKVRACDPSLPSSNLKACT